MCKRLVIPEQEDAENEISVTHPWWKFSVRFNVAVTQRVPVARLHDLETEGVMMRWGFVPSPEEGDETRPGAAHVRSDAILGAHDYRKAWLYGQRCVVPLAGFYIWHLTAAGVHQPFYVRLVNRAVFGVAALWERTVIDDEDVIDSCALMTVPANPLMAELDDRSRQMPAILRRQDYHTWLTSNAARAQELLQPYPRDRMVTHPVSPLVNDLKYDDPQLIRPAL
ncbi:MAG: response-associated peptidase [Gammaproteobacteria bacterium]|jgi:putative SOS response-associated peptidase YedK|nr:response-associated peptidase [Gammaproteobacteria bacterium]